MPEKTNNGLGHPCLRCMDVDHCDTGTCMKKEGFEARAKQAVKDGKVWREDYYFD